MGLFTHGTVVNSVLGVINAKEDQSSPGVENMRQQHKSWLLGRAGEGFFLFHSFVFPCHSFRRHQERGQVRKTKRGRYPGAQSMSASF